MQPSPFSGKTLMITGGTGSFGNAVLKRFLNTDVREVRIFSRDEKKQDDMRKQYESDKLKLYIGDVRNKDSVQSAMRGVDYVFHAAALKQVPSCEFYPMEAVRTNILGTENVVGSALATGVERMILLSTDKAVFPINAMGISKAMAEKVVLANARSLSPDATRLSVTRYGNVLASRGSIVPLFVQQIKQGRALTVTDPNMTRFLMTLESAVDLVLFAFSQANQGDTLIQKAPACTIMDLAVAVKELFDYQGDIRIIGTRHGEKQHETLMSREERVKAEELDHFYRIPCDLRDLNYAKYFSDGQIDVSTADDYTSNHTQMLDVPQIKRLLLSLEYIRHQLNSDHLTEDGLV